MTTATDQAPLINPAVIVPFANSVRAVFATMVKVDVQIQRPHLKGSPAPTYDVSTIIGFSGALAGSVVVSFQMCAAVALVSSFAGTPIAEDSRDFADALGEIANMIAGRAKKDLGSGASISVPSVIIGAGHTIARLTDVPCIVIPCTTPAGNFAVEVSIKRVAIAAE